jgi:hypothetical protein
MSNGFSQETRIVSSTTTDQGKPRSFGRRKIIEGGSKFGSILRLGLVLPDLEVLSGRRVGSASNEPRFDNVVEGSTWTSAARSGRSNDASEDNIFVDIKLIQVHPIVRKKTNDDLSKRKNRKLTTNLRSLRDPRVAGS